MKLHPMTVKKSILKTGLSGVFCLSLSSAMAAPLNITNDPLFIADSVAPGIFIMMDDSGSMDWEVLTSNYFLYSSYYKKDSWGGMNGTEIYDGLWYSFSTGGNCTGWRDFAYIFDNDDNLYGCGRATLEDNSNAYSRDWRIRSTDFNVMYYDPAQTYKPWQAKNDDTSNGSAIVFPDADFSSAKSNPQPGEAGYDDLKNLDGFVYEVANIDSYGFCGTDPDGPEGGEAHNRCSTDGDCGAGSLCTTEMVDLWDTHTRVTVSGSTVTKETFVYNPPATGDADCADTDNDPMDSEINDCLNRQQLGATVTITDPTEVAAIKQNIANWYQYNRKRSLVAKSAVASVIESAPFYRFGIGTLHDEFFTPLPADNITDYIPHNQDLFNQFAEWNWQGQGTPLRDGLKKAGTYYQGLRSGYTGSNKPIVHQCQQNFTILFTDGYYNSTVSGFGDEDGDGTSSSLADIAYYYYETDLDAFADVVPTTTFDTQNQQHMVTFTVAFGVTGNLEDTDADGWPNPLPNHVAPKWYGGTTINSDPERIDDMWHAAYDSRGSFISAKTPADVVQGLTDALSAIQDMVGSASSAAASTGASVLTDTNVFFAFFDSNDWSGDLIAYDIETNVDTQVSTFNNSINASTNFYANTRDKFYSWDPVANSAIDFDWASLNAVQQGYLNDNPDTVAIEVPGAFGAERLAFIRGVTANDGLDVDPGANVVKFRNRLGKTFGDILNSAPQFVGGTIDEFGNPLAFINPDFTEGSSYAAFQTLNQNRDHMIYVGANDGLLHGLTVDSNPATSLATATATAIATTDYTPVTTLAYLEDYGVEVFAYTPSAVIKRLNKLTTSAYETNGIATHRYMVDGSPTVEDAYIGSWKTVLVSGLGGGGQGVFALDVTDGASTASNSVVLWEFNDSDDAELGYTYSRPVVVRLHDGNWYAIFGNGYNNTETNDMDGIPDSSVSTTGHAVLFILKMSGPTGANNSWVLGTDYYKLDTGAGSVTTPNALATVSTLDMDRDQVVDGIYAGDLLGNLWRFDLLDLNPASASFGSSVEINSGGFPAAVANGATQPTTLFRVAYGTLGTPAPVFTADAGQPITSAPVVSTHPVDGFMVIFGTGQYVESGDNQTTGLPTQSFYGIWDDCVISHEIGNDGYYQIVYKGTNIPASATSCTTVAKSSLLQQSIVKEQIEVFTEAVDSNNDGVIDDNDTPIDKNTEEVRITTGYKLAEYDKSSTPVNTQNTISGTDQFGNTISLFTYTSETGWLNNTNSDPALPPAITAVSHRGWYLDMIFNGNNKSERNVNKPLLLSGTVFFNTYTPSNSSSCGAAGDTWIYALNASDGRQLASSAFDLNKDGEIDQQDQLNQNEVVGARKMEGFTPGGTIINAGKTKHTVSFGDELGDLYSKVKEGRQNWRVIK